MRKLPTGYVITKNMNQALKHFVQFQEEAGNPEFEFMACQWGDDWEDAIVVEYATFEITFYPNGSIDIWLFPFDEQTVHLSDWYLTPLRHQIRR